MCGSTRFFSPNFADSVSCAVPTRVSISLTFNHVFNVISLFRETTIFCVLRQTFPSIESDGRKILSSRESEDLYEFEWFQNIISHFDLHVLNKFHTWLTVGCNFSFPPVLNFTVFYIWYFNWCEKLCQQCSLNRARHECGSTNISRSVKYFAGLTVLFINLTNHNGRQLE